MARIIQGWLEFNGRKSDEFGARLMDGVQYVRPAWRGTSETVAGRSGDLWETDDTYEPVEIKRQLRCRLSRLDDIAAWLTGSGLLRFSWAENRAYEARAVKTMPIKQVSIDSDPLVEFTAAFTCQPFRLLYPEKPSQTITQSGQTIINPGTASSLPRVKITGSGDFNVTIGMEALFFTGVDGGGIIVDSQLMDALTYDGALLANDKMSGKPWEIRPGNNTVRWQGNVTSVEILPRWRYI